MIRPRPTIALLAAVMVIGCTAAAPSTKPGPTPSKAPTFAIRTAPAQPQACMEALITGSLARVAASGLGLATPGLPPVTVEWPFRYSARDEGGRISLIDETGKVVAREGDKVQMGGGMGQLNIWYTCGPVQVVAPNQ